MLDFQGKRVFLACGKTDGRKGIVGLVSIVQDSFALDPFEPAVFVFCNGARNRLKILEFDGDGFWLHLKKLEGGSFQWPEEGKDKTMTLTDAELHHLLGSPGLIQKLRRISYGHAIA